MYEKDDTRVNKYTPINYCAVFGFIWRVTEESIVVVYVKHCQMCRQSMGRQSMCRQSMCRQYLCRQSMCRQSLCRQSMLIMLKRTSRHSFPYLCLPICLLSPSVRTAVAFTVIFTEVSQCPTPFFVGHVSQGKHHSCNLQRYHIVYKHVRSQ